MTYNFFRKKKKEDKFLEIFFSVFYKSVKADIVGKMPKRKMQRILNDKTLTRQYLYSFLSTYTEIDLEHENISTSRKSNNFIYPFNFTGFSIRMSIYDPLYTHVKNQCSGCVNHDIVK